MANFGRLTTLAEKIAERLGYESASQAEAQMGARFVQQVESEADKSLPSASKSASTELSPYRYMPEREARETNVGFLRAKATPEPQLRLPSAPEASTPAVAGMAFTPQDRELSRRLLLGGGAAALGGAALAGDTERKAEAKPAQSGASTRNEPSVPEEAPGSPPSATPSGGVDSTVARAQARVNAILPNRPSEGSLRKAVGEYEKAAAALKEQAVDTTDIDQQLADAKALYQEKANRNEMLSVVQMIAQSFAKLAAYNYGSRNGRYIADQVSVPGTDYEKRTDRAMDEYKLASGEAREQRRTELERADKRYGIERDKVNSLRERIGAEESALGRATSAYTSELTNMRADQRADEAEEKAGKRSAAEEARFNRMFGQKDYDNVQQEEAALSRQEQAVNSLTQAMTADSKDTRKRIPDLAAKAGVSPEELEQAQKETTEEGIIFDSAHPDKAAQAISQKLLPGIREKLDALRARKQIANEMSRTGESMDRVRARLEAGSNAGPNPGPSEKAPTPEQIVEYKRRNPTVPEDVAIRTMTDRLNGR